MSGINQHVVYSVTRICSEFCSDLGNEPIKSFGTGFFIKSQDDETIFVTNKHMLDPSLSLGATKGYSLKSIELQLRSKSNLSHTKFIILTSYKIENSRDSDVSVIYDIEIPPDNNYDYISPHVFPISDLADEDFFQNTLKIVDPASFIGFAGTRSSSWWDTGNNLPIARHANIASLPQINFNNPSIKTTEVILVSGFSFQGSSGSPTFSHLKKKN